jgi:hypothetical protein
MNSKIFFGGQQKWLEAIHHDGISKRSYLFKIHGDAEKPLLL